MYLKNLLLNNKDKIYIHLIINALIVKIKYVGRLIRKIYVCTNVMYILINITKSLTRKQKYVYTRI